MADAQSYQFRRDDSPAFDSKSYYTLNNLNLPSYTLSAGVFLDSNGATNLTAYGTLSSENWQLFYQSGRYFIRNYDYGSKWQLGLTEDSRSTPKLYPRSGSLGQQWTLNKVNGGWEMTNGLWGEGTMYALPKNWPLPAMRSEDDGTVWNITSNPSAAQLKPFTSDMLSPVDNIEQASTSSSTLPSATSSDSVPKLTGLPSLAPASVSNPPTTSLSLSSNTPPSTQARSSALSSGAIAGIVIGAMVLFSALVLTIWFVRVKRKHKRDGLYQHGVPVEVHGHSAPVEKYAYYGSELHVPPAELAAQRDKETVENRVELESRESAGKGR